MKILIDMNRTPNWCDVIWRILNRSNTERTNMVSVSDIVKAINSLDGKAELKKIYEQVYADKKGKVSENYTDVIRGQIYYNSSDSRSWLVVTTS
jgi:hypothetical protein